MLVVATELKHSPINGFGLFAAEDIPAGTVIWREEPGFDTRIPMEKLATLPAPAVAFVKHFGYRSPDHPTEYLVCNDDSRFMNHAVPSNTNDGGDSTIARVDIKKGDEITCNYFDFYLFDAGEWAPTQ
jgi:SET domain-containing protein